MSTQLCRLSIQKMRAAATPELMKSSVKSDIKTNALNWTQLIHLQNAPNRKQIIEWLREVANEIESEYVNGGTMP